MASFVGDEVLESKLPEIHQSDVKKAVEEELNDCPIDEVRLTVPVTDDPSEPALTFRTCFLGMIACGLLAYLNQFFWYRTNPLTIGSATAQIIALPIGKLMARTLPKRDIRVPFTKWSFSLNPGPFNMKEHVLITIFAGCGANTAYAVHIITSVKAYYHRPLHPVAGMLLVQTTQLLGYGWAGLFRKYLVDSPYMWWPSNMVQVSLFRTLHEKDKRPKGGLTRLQFFLMVFICSFAYYIVPGYLFPSISFVSFVCLIWKDSITAQQIGSARNGMGLGSFGLDWSTVAFLGSPLATPLFAIFNVFAGFILFLWVLVPIVYYSNAFEAKRFPFFSSRTLDSTGKTYNVSRILTDDFDINIGAYNNYSKLYLPAMFAFIYGISFATLTATITHVALFHGKTIWKMWRKATSVAGQLGDVHTRLMKRNYEVVPEWWFQAVLVISLALALCACEGFGRQLQLPWWGLLFACAIAFFFTLPIGIIQATTNLQPGLNVITELIIGYIYPGRPLANVAFKTYGYMSMSQALLFTQDFKLGHYMKVPPKSMFIVQLVGTIVASSVSFGTAWWLLTTVENICNTSLLSPGSPWTCPGDEVFYNASIIWGVVGPRRMFTKLGVYPQMNWFFLVGFLAPIPGWFFSRKYPEKKWIRLINVPLILGGLGSMLPARAVHYLMWVAVGIFFNFYVYRWHRKWWARHTYILSAALDAGVAFMGVLLFLLLQNKNINGPEWWGLGDDHCPLATCPTAPGIKVKGCPVH
ncbi:oligopeptide transporter 1-like [Tripterygium wilfordii]|uniref:Oligopeptide transporter 1-like n=1 Tax=Tripterygium wilfordii TaxID=458696 RepID=A0A7J7C8K1_TRIWF|nr:oligopeptide transporter 5-like [Tripterygium wilfordii]KAF5730459.1 oligopeptide transporter 1-like [Tripterygium wilfordii]